MASSRYNLPGFTLTSTRDTAAREVEVGKIEDGVAVFGVEVWRSKIAPNANFLVRDITDGSGKSLWSEKEWRSHNPPFEGHFMLAWAPDSKVFVLAFVGRTKEGKVEQIIPLQNLLSKKPLGLRRAMLLKREVGKFLQRSHALSPNETSVIRIFNERHWVIENAAREAARKEREDRRIARTLAIMSRHKIEAFTADGRRRTGWPVLEEEWAGLSKGSPAIIISSVGGGIGNWELGQPLEYFVVYKARGETPQKRFRVAVYTEAQSGAQVEEPVVQYHTRDIIIEYENEIYQVLVFPDQEAIRLARESGLNSGTLVTVDMADKEGRYVVQEIHTDRVDTWGPMKPLL